MIYFLTYLFLFCYNRMIGCNLIIPGGTRVIDATSMLVMPGNINYVIIPSCYK